MDNLKLADIFDSIEALKRLWLERIQLIEREAYQTKNPVTLARLQGRIDELKHCIEMLG